MPKRIRVRDFTPEGRARALLYQARTRSQRAGLEFDLELRDVVIPSHCPALGIKIDCGPKDRKWGCPNSPSLDRRDPTRGYTRDNVQVLSWRANMLKRDATAAELRALANFMDGAS